MRTNWFRSFASSPLVPAQLLTICGSAVRQTFPPSQARPANAVVLSVPSELLRNDTSNDNVYQHHRLLGCCLSFPLLVACTDKI